MTDTHLLVQTVSGVTVVTIRATSLLDGPTIVAMSKDLYDLIDNQAQRKVLLDFRSVQFLSSSMLGVLIQMQKKAAAIKGRLAITGMKPDLMKVFKITHLDKIFSFYEDEIDAMRSFGVLA